MPIEEIVIAYSTNIFFALLIFFIGKKLASIITNTIIRIMSKSSFDKTIQTFLSNAIYSILLVIVTLASLNKLGIETTSFVAILGAIGLAIGLAFKDALSNISAGVMIIIFKPLKVGEFIEAGGSSGTVEEVNIFNTIMKTGDNKIIIVPNSSIINKNITNYSREKTRRVDLTFSIGYSDDLKLAKNTLIEILNNDERILKDPAPFVAVSELADSSVNFITRSWVNSEDYKLVQFDTLETVKLTFDEKGISIPYPQMDIHQN